MVNIQRGNVYAKKSPMAPKPESPGWFEKYVVAPAATLGTSYLNQKIGESMPSTQAKTELMETQTKLNKQALADPNFQKKLQAMKSAGLVW